MRKNNILSYILSGALAITPACSSVNQSTPVSTTIRTTYQDSLKMSQAYPEHFPVERKVYTIPENVADKMTV